MGMESFLCVPVKQEERGLKVRLAKDIPVRREHTFGPERVLGRAQAKLALKKAPAIFPKMPHVSLNAPDVSHQRQGSGPTSMALMGPCELDWTGPDRWECWDGKAGFYWLFPPVVFTICVF